MRFRRSAARQFGIRFVISLAVLGGAYLLIFGLPTSHKLTPTQKLAALRASLDQGYIYSNDIVNFNDDSVVAYANLSSLLAQFKANTLTLQKTLRDAGSTISTAQHNTIQSIIDSEKQVVSMFQTQYSPFSSVIAYDPSTDLGNLDINKDATKLTQRAQAAQTGLNKAVGNNSLDDVTDRALQDEADCFGKISSSLSAKQLAAAASARSTCVSKYPSVRQTAIQYVIRVSFNNSYRSYLDQHIPTLLSQLDKAINR